MNQLHVLVYAMDAHAGPVSRLDGCTPAYSSPFKTRVDSCSGKSQAPLWSVKLQACLFSSLYNVSLIDQVGLSPCTHIIPLKRNVSYVPNSEDQQTATLPPIFPSTALCIGFAIVDHLTTMKGKRQRKPCHAATKIMYVKPHLHAFYWSHNKLHFYSPRLIILPERYQLYKRQPQWDWI